MILFHQHEDIPAFLITAPYEKLDPYLHLARMKENNVAMVT
jgi:hypothetical protein